MLRLVTWNIRYFSHAMRGITSIDGTQRAIAVALAKMRPQPDVIALQEIDDASFRSLAFRARGRSQRGEPVSNFDRFYESLNRQSLELNGGQYQAQFYPAQGHRGGIPIYSTGLAILYRSGIELVDHNGHEPHDITHRRIQRLAHFKQKRICAWARLRDPDGHELDLFNTHLSLPAFLQRTSGTTGGRFGEADNQMAEIDSLLEFVSQRGAPERTLLVGDFNALPGSRVYNAVTESFRDAHATFLQKAPEAMVRMPSAGFMNLRYRLDHVFAGAGIHFHDFDDTASYGAAHPLAPLSDHAPLIGRFTFEPA